VNSANKPDEEDSSFLEREKAVLTRLFQTAIPAAKGKNIGVFCSSNPVLLDTHQLLSNLKRDLGFSLLTHIGELGKNMASRSSGVSQIEDDYEALCRVVGFDIGKSKDPNVRIELFKRLAEVDQTTLLLGVQGGTLSEA
jgi:hypothetical protein